MNILHQGSALHRTAITKGDKTRCDGVTTIRGVQQTCGAVIAIMRDPNNPGGRHDVTCRRCGKSHTV